MAQEESFWSLAIYVFLVIAVILVMLAGYFLGEKSNSRAKNEPYESGILASSQSYGGFPAHFYLFAMFFVVFDLETVFLVSYSLVARSLGILGLVHLFIFVGFLFLALVYLYRSGGFFIEGKKHDR